MYINSDFTNSLIIQDLDRLVQYNRRASYKHLPSRDTRQLMSLLVNLVKIDRHLFSAVDYRCLATSSYTYELKFPDGIKPTPEEEKYLADLKLRWKQTGMDSARKFIVRSSIAGMGAMQLDWTGYNNLLKHHVKAKKIIPLTEIDYDLDNTGAIKWVDTDTKTQRFTRKDFDPNTTMRVFNNPLTGFEEDFPGGMLRTVMVAVLIKYWDFFTWARNNEKTMIWAEYEPQFEKKLAVILSQLANIGDESFGAFPKGVAVHVLEALKEGAIKSHQAMNDVVNREIHLVICGQYSMVDPKAGNGYAQSKVSYDVSEEVTFSDLDKIEEVIDRDYLVHDFTLNMGEPRNGYPVLEHNRLYIHDRESQARMVTDYINANIPMHKKDVYDSLNFQRIDSTTPPEDIVTSVKQIGG